MINFSFRLIFARAPGISKNSCMSLIGSFGCDVCNPANHTRVDMGTLQRRHDSSPQRCIGVCGVAHRIVGSMIGDKFHITH
jgi:hypothetical protein